MNEMGEEESKRLWYVIGVISLLVLAMLVLLDYMNFF